MWFVYFNDDFSNSCTGAGLASFDNKKQAENFIKTRMERLDSDDSCYTVIDGRMFDIEVSRTIDSVSITGAK